MGCLLFYSSSTIFLVHVYQEGETSEEIPYPLEKFQSIASLPKKSYLTGVAEAQALFIAVVIYIF